MDDVDISSQRQEQLDAMALAEARRIAGTISAGHAGTCDKCGEESQRLMPADFFKWNRRSDIAEEIEDGICPRCRDRLKLP